MGIAAEAREHAPSRRELSQLRARVTGTQRDLDAARAAPPPRRSPQQIELEIGALMQKAAAQAQRIATGGLGPVAAGPQQLSTRRGSSTSSSSRVVSEGGSIPAGIRPVAHPPARVQIVTL